MLVTGEGAGEHVGELVAQHRLPLPP
jgi:hypothetical protein